MSTGAVSAAGQSSQETSAPVNAWEKVNLDSFVNLLVTELQNQDPMEPMKSQEILQQISQIREIQSNQQLADTLESVLLGQSLATASGLLGQTVTGLSDDAEKITGQVDRVSIEEGLAKVHVGDATISLKNLGGISQGEQGEESEQGEQSE